MIRLLQSADWKMWKQIRLEAVKLNPEAFGGSWEEESVKADSEFQTSVEKNSIFAKFDRNGIVGVAGFYIFAYQKMRHRGNLYSMYVKPEERGKGFSSELLLAVLDYAKDKVLQIHCSVVTTNVPALTLYKKHGFTVYGEEFRSLKIGEKFYDEFLMLKRFD